jgi:hypothetical protein
MECEWLSLIISSFSDLHGARTIFFQAAIITDRLLILSNIEHFCENYDQSNI